jgi:L-alanine-DL-glutamate epimerase-like enolase superfamily enzyme
MKAGGISTARKIAAVAAREGLSLMWGCMDESRISIAAALHVAFSCKATKYLDLDGHLDLDHDVVSGGFVLEDGYMRLTNAYGLGVEKINDPRN